MVKTFKSIFMKLKNALLVVAISGFAIACNNKGKTSNTTDSSNYSTENKTSTTTKTSVEVPPATMSSFESKYPTITDVAWNHYESDVPIDWQWVGWPEMNQNDYVA